MPVMSKLRGNPELLFQISTKYEELILKFKGMGGSMS